MDKKSFKKNIMMYKDHIKCILCGNEKLELVTTKLRDSKPGSIYRCPNCDINMLKDQTGSNDLQNWYDGGYRKEHGPKLSQKNEYKDGFHIFYPDSPTCTSYDRARTFYARTPDQLF